MHSFDRALAAIAMHSLQDKRRMRIGRGRCLRTRPRHDKQQNSRKHPNKSVHGSISCKQS
jgi:hypothetical protein